MKLLILILLYLFDGAMGFSQTDTLLYYFNKDFESTNADSAIYIGYGFKTGDQFQFKNYHYSTGRLVESSTFTDSTLNVRNGLSEIFYPSGVPKSKGKYRYNIADGLWLYWDNAGNLTDSNITENGKRMLISHWSYKDGVMTNYVFGDKKNHIETRMNYDDAGNLVLDTKTTNGSGYLKKFYPDGKLLLSQVIENDKVKEGTQYKPDGTALSKQEIEQLTRQDQKEYEKKEKEYMAKLPEFPGGMEALNAYIGRKLDYRGTSLEQDIRAKQNLTVSFMLDETGHAYDIIVLDATNIDLQELIKRILVSMPAWKMKGYKKYGPITRSYIIH